MSYQLMGNGWQSIFLWLVCFTYAILLCQSYVKLESEDMYNMFCHLFKWAIQQHEFVSSFVCGKMPTKNVLRNSKISAQYLSVCLSYGSWSRTKWLLPTPLTLQTLLHISLLFQRWNWWWKQRDLMMVCRFSRYLMVLQRTVRDVLPVKAESLGFMC